MKKIPVFVLKPSFLVAFCCFVLLNICQAQPKLTLWYDAAAKYQAGHHQHKTSKEIPCDWIYYRFYDGESDTLYYGIKNEGDAPLTLNLPLVFDANLYPNFSILEQPDKAVLQPGEDTHFKVAYRASKRYRSVRANLPINSNVTDCGIRFWIGGPAPPTDFPFCYKNLISEQDFDNDMVFDQVISNTQTFDDRGNITQLIAFLDSPVGNQLGSRTITNTYDTNNNLLTNTIVDKGIYIRFDTISTTTNTYDANNNLLTQVIVGESRFGDFTETITNTYNANNHLISSTTTFISPFGPGPAVTTTYTYDANNNLLMETTLFPPVTTTIVYTYDANNNLLTKNITEMTPGGTATDNTTNTYDANNNLLMSTVIITIPFLGTHTITTTNTYDANEKLTTTSIIDAGFDGDFERKYTNTYDANLRVISRFEEFFFNPGRVKTGDIVYTVTPCELPQISIADPCNCIDPLNKKNNQDIITYFHDVLSVNGTPGDVVILQTGNTNFLDDNLAQIANGAMLGTIPASGTLEYDFFHASEASGAITLNVGGVLSNPFDISVCSAKSCVVIPTMSQWGLLIFGLLMLNLSIFLIYHFRLV